MSKLTKEQVMKLAHLSKLELSDEEVAQYQEELSRILAYFEQLELVDTTGLSPTYQVSGLKNSSREDVIMPYEAKPKGMLESAPQLDGAYIKVGRMI